MRAGKTDRRITIRRAFTLPNDFGEQVESWFDISEVWAQQRPIRGGERFAAQEQAGTQVLTFHIRYRGDLTVRDRIAFKGFDPSSELTAKEYNITDVREIGRGSVTEFDAVARSD